MRDVVFKLIDQFTEGVDTYHNNGSMWLIFTDDKKWVIELTKDGTLWYNFYFFQDCFKYLSLDVVENQHYITEWVEDTIQNGVRSTDMSRSNIMLWVEDTIQNGVRNTKMAQINAVRTVEGIIQNGVRKTHIGKLHWLPMVEDTIQNGIKDVIGQIIDAPELVNDAIQNGIKLTTTNLPLSEDDGQITEIEDVITNGIKETKHGIHFFEDTTENVIKNGIKKTKSPGADGDLLSTIEWMESNNSKSVPEMIDDVITNGIKETNWRKVDNHPTYLDNIINKGH